MRTIESAEDTCTARQVRFAYEYLATPDLNGTRAAITVGVPASSAASQASKWLRNPNVATLVSKLKTERAERVVLTSDDVLRELSYICRSDITDLIVEADGVWRMGCAEDVKKLPKSMRAAVLSIDIDEEKLGKKVIRTRTTIKLHPKVAALALAGKHVDVRAFETPEQGTQPITLIVESGLGAPPGSNAGEADDGDYDDE